MSAPWENLFRAGRVLKHAFAEQQECIADVYRRIDPYLRSPDGTPDGYAVTPGAIPASYLTWRRNLFSTLFHSVYFPIGSDRPRRLLYGRLIHLYRIWVTSADNLLDSEDKVVVPTTMPGDSRVMRQVVAVMAADRVLAEVLDEAVADDTISHETARALLRDSLRRLLPSAAQESTEAGGIVDRPDPEHVLQVIHRLKTGLLFNIAFVGPELAEPRLDPVQVAALKDALMSFGLGCQVLDDVRDLGRDLRDGRHNYVLSWLQHHRPDALAALRQVTPAQTDRLYLRVPEAAIPAAERGLGLMRDGLGRLGRAGLGFGTREADRMAGFMYSVLDVGEMRRA